MDTKPLLYGLIGFFIGGFIVSVAATTFEKSDGHEASSDHSSMNALTVNLQNKTGDEYDEAFIASMIDHHEGAIVMAKLSNANAKHDEIKQLSSAIIAAQEQEIKDMKQWQRAWGYKATATRHKDTAQSN